jgi:hypothetical protein
MLRRPLFVFALVAAFGVAPSAIAEEWKQLFNGRDLEGWTVKITGHAAGDNYAETFRVEQGLLKVGYQGYDGFGGRFGHLFWREALSHYRLRVEYRFVDEQCAGGPEWALRNSGVMVHGQSVESMGLDQEFPDSIEVQFLGGDGTGERPTANLCTPGTHVVLDGALETRAIASRRRRRPITATSGSPSRWRSAATSRFATSSTARPCSNTPGRSWTMAPPWRAAASRFKPRATR